MNLHRRRPRRLIAGVLAGALAFSASPLLATDLAAAADALPPLANPIADGAFCDGAPSNNPFTDLGAESASTRETILCLVATELTTGTTATTFSPGLSVTRRQMAQFVARLADLLDDLETGTAPLAPLPVYDGSSDFSDVASNDPAAASIGRLSQADIVGGFPDGTFRGGEPVSRRQMAAFINRLQDFIGGDPYTTTKDFFTDDEGDAGEANLNALAAFGIFQGDGQGHVFPAAPITRRQMANVLLRDAQVFFSLGVVDSPFGPASNATYTVTPTTTVAQETATEPSTADDRQYTASGLKASTTYTIQLFPAANVHGADTDTITFTEDGSTNTANEGAVAADITVVNGTTVVGADDDATAQAVNGQITFTLDGVANESVVPVIYRDADSDGNLDLAADNTPVATEPFGVGGEVQYLPPEATVGAHPFTVTSVTSDRGAFVSDGATYYMDANDTYKYTNLDITRAQFDAMLSVGDVGSTTYNPDPTGASTFNITTDHVDAPAAPTVTVVAAVNGTALDDGRITYTRPATNSPGVTYALQRAVVATGVDTECGTIDDLVGSFATVAGATQAAGTGSGVFVFSDNNVPDGCYSYRIRATSPGSGVTADSAGSTATPFPTPPDTTGPVSVFATMTTKAGLIGTFDTGDVIKIVFNEPMIKPVEGAMVQLRDGDLTIAKIVAGPYPGSNATFTSNSVAETVNGVPRPAGTVFTITLTGAPTITSPGVTTGLQVPADVTDRSGIADVAGNSWDLGSGDITIE